MKEWIEGKTPIEEQLSKILAGIEFKGMKDRDETIRIHTIWERKKEKQRIAKELQDRKEKELMNFKSYLLNLKGMRKQRLYEGTLKNLKIMLFKVMNLQKILKTKSNGPEKRPIGMILLLNPMMNY